MKKLKSALVILSIFSILILGCGGNAKKHNEEGVSTKPAKVSSSAEIGQKYYKIHCMACHKENGEGLPKVYPPITNNAIVSGNKSDLIKIILDGLSGEREVNGETYNGAMPGLRETSLSDDQIAGILSYIRTEKFGNAAEGITPEEVSALR